VSAGPSCLLLSIGRGLAPLVSRQSPAGQHFVTLAHSSRWCWLVAVRRIAVPAIQHDRCSQGPARRRPHQGSAFNVSASQQQDMTHCLAQSSDLYRCVPTLLATVRHLRRCCSDAACKWQVWQQMRRLLRRQAVLGCFCCCAGKRRRHHDQIRRSSNQHHLTSW
jgi:hypothetical protein